ncbi:MAG: hypothetical protein LUC90_00360 [Lachnospiraceae bacterium]|nr:hypothetical protein [Lachnospiraceae bacterium]
MKTRHILTAMLAVTVMIISSGCGTVSLDAVSQDTIGLAKDQSLTYTIVADFDEEYYDVDELTAMAEAETEESGLGIRVSSAEVTDNVLSFTYEMDSADDYQTFMETSCYLGTIASAFSDSYKLQVTVTSVKDQFQITLADVSHTDYSLFIWNEIIAVRCPGKVVYYSTNLELTDDYDVVPLADSTGPYFVVYR